MCAAIAQSCERQKSMSCFYCSFGVCACLPHPSISKLVAVDPFTLVKMFRRGHRRRSICARPGWTRVNVELHYHLLVASSPYPRCSLRIGILHITHILCVLLSVSLTCAIRDRTYKIPCSFSQVPATNTATCRTTRVDMFYSCSLPLVRAFNASTTANDATMFR